MTDTQNPKDKRQPEFYIHTRVKAGRDTRLGARVGVGFKHRTTEGINIFLDAQPIPLDGRIELVAFPSDA